MMTRWIGVLMCMLVWTNHGKAQTLDQQVSFNYQQKPLKYILKKIKRNHRLRFSYSNSLLPLNKRVTLKVKKLPLKQALNQLFFPLDINYMVIGNQIVLKKKIRFEVTQPSDSAAPAPQYVIVKIRLADAETQQPIPNVHIHYQDQLIATSNPKGEALLKLTKVPNMRLSFSHVSYQYFKQYINPNKQSEYLLKLYPKIEDLELVTITVNHDKRWAKLFRRFAKKFLGTSRNAQKCDVLNPWVVEFEETSHGIRLKNSTIDTLKIQNNALGYELKFLLKKFQQELDQITYTGDCWFTELKPESTQQQQKWKKNRRKAYRGSFAHFLAAIANQRPKKEGFEISASPTLPPSSAKSYIYPSIKQLVYFDEASKLYVLGSSYYLRIAYYGEQEEYAYLQQQKSSNPQVKPRLKPGVQVSWLWLNGYSITFNKRSMLVDNADKVVRLGYWGWEGVGEMLPNDYLKAMFKKIAAKNKKRRRKR
jgi:hypothetical protein